MLTFSTFAILLPAAIMLHVTEEFLFPGGFIEWYAEFRPPKTAGVRPGYLVWINTLMIGVCVLPFYFGETRHGSNVWFLVAAIAAANAVFHIIGVITLRKYSPGVITGTALYLPLFFIGGWYFISSGYVSWGKAITFIALAIGYHIFSYIRQGK